MHNFELYEDQEEFIQKLRIAISQGHKSILGVASPAFGKTVVAGEIISIATNKNNSSVWFLVHRKNLLRQTSKSFWSAKIEHGLLTSGKMRSNQAVQVGTIGTVYNRMPSLSAPNILFVDEAHLSLGMMFESIIRWALEAGSIVIGLTGTPERLDGKGLGNVYDVMVQAKPTSWLIEQGRLSEYVIYSKPQGPNLSGVAKRSGDYRKEELSEIMDKPSVLGDAVEHWKRLANGLRTVAYCVDVKHSKHTASSFIAAGVPAVHVDANTTESELKSACEGLASGKYKVLCNCELVIEGFDLSAQVGMDVTLECCMLLRPTMSKARYLQMIFRALRKKDRAAIILDHAGCAIRHGLPDQDHDWSLEGRKKGSRKKDDDEPNSSVKQCKKCFAIFRAGPSECPKCGEPVLAGRQEIKQIEGELVKIDIAEIRKERKKAQGAARTTEDLIKLGISRDMKNPSAWAAITIAARKGGKPTAKEFLEARIIYQRLIKGGDDQSINENNGGVF